MRKRVNYPFTRTRKNKEKAESKTLSKELGAAAGMVAHLILPVLGSQREEDRCQFDTIKGYIARFCTKKQQDRVTHRKSPWRNYVNIQVY